MAMPHHIRFAANAILGIVFVTAIGYWFMNDWTKRNMAEIIAGTSSEDTGIFARESNEFRETGRRQRLTSLLVDPQALDSFRTVKLTLIVPKTTFWRAGEAPPPEHLEQLYIEARAPAMLQERCADWQAVLASRCKMLNASLDLQSGPPTGQNVSIVAVYAISPKTIDPVEGDPDSMSIQKMQISFDINPNTTTEATRRDVLAQAYKIYQTACADLRERIGNCNLMSYEFRESPLRDGQFNLSGGAMLAGLVSGKS